MAIVSRGLGRGLITGALVAFGLGIAPHQVDVPAQATAVQQEGNGGSTKKRRTLYAQKSPAQTVLEADDREVIEILSIMMSDIL